MNKLKNNCSNSNILLLYRRKREKKLSRKRRMIASGNSKGVQARFLMSLPFSSSETS